MGVLRALPGLHGVIGQPTAQVIDGSLMFNGVNQSLERVFSSGGNRRTFTLSYWIKEHGQKGTSPTNNPHVLWSGTAVETRGGMAHRGTAGDDAGRIYMFNQVSNSTDSAVWTNSKHRDFSGWKHVVFKVDSTQGTGTNRVKIYINGVEQDDQYKTTPSQNLQFQINVAQEHRIGRGIPDDYGNFSLSQYYFIDGQALGPEYFAFTDPLTNTWRPIKYTGTYGTTGFWLPMDNQDNFEKDRSGNGNHWTKSNFSSGTYGTFNNPNVLKDSPSGAVFGGRAQTGITTTSSAPANYCTLNPIDKESNVVLSNGNLDGTASGGDGNYRGTMRMISGKFYWEVTQVGGGNYSTYGIIRDGQLPISELNSDTITYRNDGLTKKNGADGSTYNSISGDEVLGIACDCDKNEISYYKNNTLQGTLTFTTNMAVEGVYAYGRWNSGKSADYNFGQKPFKYAPPQGFLPVNFATTRPNTVISRPDQYVGVTTYSGSGNTLQEINLGFKPDFVWCKSRSNAENNALFDSVRGPTKFLRTDSTDDEYTISNVNFTKKGFSFANGSGEICESGQYYVARAWRAGGNKNTFNIDDVGYATAAAAGLDGGSINPTGASIGTKQGFSIIGYTGTDNTSDTFAHGLSQKPDFALFKNRSQDGDDWISYNSTPSLGATKRVKFNTADGSDSQTSQFNDTEPTSSLFTIGTYDNINKLNNNYIAYIWHNVPGLQKFGEYLGDGGSGDDGPFVETGFRPAMIWLRPFAGSGIANNGGWYIWDVQNDSNPYNDDVAVDKPGNKFMYGNLTNSMDSHAMGGIDILSNGFRLRADSSGYSNKDGWSYIYGAFAAAPVSNLYGGQSNAR